MCLIIDANVVSLVLAPVPAADFRPVWKALSTKKAVAVYGGQLTREYSQLTGLRSLLAELDRQGILRKVPDADVEKMTHALIGEGLCVSDDPHIIALARVSGTRLLCSHDVALHADFTNPSLLKPRGSVYQCRSHEHLIRKHCRKSARSGKTAPPR